MSDTLRITTHDYEWHPKYFAIIVGLFCGLYVTDMAIASKVIHVFGLTLPGAIILFPVCCIITDIITEVYGFNRTRQAIWTVLASVILFALFTQAAIILPPASVWPNQEAFATTFGTSWRLVLAGCCAWVIGEFMNSYVMARMKVFQNARFMAGRFIASTVVGQLFDSAVFIVIAFGGTMPWADLGIMILSGWAVKVAYEAIALPLSVPIARKLKAMEGVEHFDKQKISLV